MGARHLIVSFGLAMAVTPACTGPRVTLADVQVHQSPIPGYERAETTIRNTGGRGDVQVTARIRDRHTDRVYKTARSVAVEAKEELGVVIDVPAPPGAYFVTMEATYPPD